MKRRLLALGTHPWVAPLFRGLLRGRAMVFMLHRFADPATSTGGASAAFLSEGLRELRREGFQFVRLDTLFLTAAEGGDVSRMVAFTVDDGYRDFLLLAAPVFEEHGCPVTVFLPTRFVDDPGWQWWDRVRYALHRTRVSGVVLRGADGPVRFSWRDSGSRSAAGARMEEVLSGLPPAVQAEAMSELERQLGVPYPSELPERMRPLSWEEVRKLERRGVSFGPHSVSHPNLALADETKLRYEVEESWARVRKETHDPVPVFCYPYGIAPDLDSGGARIFKDAGLIGAVLASPGYASESILRERPLRVPRFSWPANLLYLRQLTTGVERAKALLPWRR